MKKNSYNQKKTIPSSPQKKKMAPTIEKIHKKNPTFIIYLFFFSLSTFLFFFFKRKKYIYKNKKKISLTKPRFPLKKRHAFIAESVLFDCLYKFNNNGNGLM
jgi:hypothetical protein